VLRRSSVQSGAALLACNAAGSCGLSLTQCEGDGPPGHALQELWIAGKAVHSFPTRLLIDQIRSIDTGYVVGDPVDYLLRDEMDAMEIALGHYLGMISRAPRD